ncbi:MAG TPA: fatty acyl-AMP ligase [Acidimicrobiales bacterium]|jgi:fatty-acyl-CoA synthase|nr:fatty acyl-AMP ligase [Acidimicrobiales bacterium]
MTSVDSLPARIEAAAQRGHSITFVTNGETVDVPWTQMLEESKAVAAALQERGIGTGSHVALLGPTTRALVTAIEGVWLAGATVVVLPLPMRMGSLDEFVLQTRARIRAADIDLLLADADLAAFIEPADDDPPLVCLGELEGDAASFKQPQIDPDDLAVLQFTSGSTSDPKGVMLPHRVILANLDGVAAAAEMDPDDDVLVSWLPLYHDMGLIGLMTLSMINGCRLVLGAPQDFMGAPARWMQWISDFGGTATAGPNFSYALAARALRRMEGLDLSRWRIALNGAEPVDPQTVAEFIAEASRFGFKPGSAFPAFGMAEVAIGGTFPKPGRGIVVDTVDRAILENERYAAPVEPGSEGSRGLAKLGTPIPGLEMRIVDTSTGVVMKDREVGELQLRGTSVTPGYYKHPEATAATFTDDGWLKTGDLGYIVADDDGTRELVICGRIKDVIIVGGRNVFPEDVERAVANVDGVRAGNVIAFGIEGRKGKEALVVVAETKTNDLEQVRQEVSIRVREAVGLPAEEIVLVQAGTLPKTSSGKLQRSLCRTKFLEADLQLV